MKGNIREKLQHYLDDRLSPGEREELEALIEQDEAVREQYRQSCLDSLLGEVLPDNPVAANLRQAGERVEELRSRLAEADYWSLEFAPGIAPGAALAQGETVSAMACPPDSARLNVTRVPISLVPTGRDPVSFRIASADWPSGLEPVSITLTQLSTIAREPLRFNVPASLLPRVHRVDRAGSTDPAAATGPVDVAAESRLSLNLSVAADDGTALRQPRQPGRAAGNDFQCQFSPRGAIMRLRASLPPDTPLDFVWVEIRTPVDSREEQRLLHRALLCVEQDLAGWVSFEVPSLDLGDAPEAEFTFRSMEPADIRLLHECPVDAVDELLAEQPGCVLLANPGEGGWEFSAPWPSYQSAIVDPAYGWVLRVAGAAGKGGSYE